MDPEPDSIDWRAGYRQAQLGLVGVAIDAVTYYDPIEFEDGFQGFIDPITGTHALGWGLDLVLGDRRLGFTWDWDGDDYRLAIRTDGLAEVMKSNGYGACARDCPEWKLRFGRQIESVVFSVHSEVHEVVDKICDCRICFAGAPPVWIAARYATRPHPPYGDDIVLFFDEAPARCAGVLVESTQR